MGSGAKEDMGEYTDEKVKYVRKGFLVVNTFMKEKSGLFVLLGCLFIIILSFAGGLWYIERTHPYDQDEEGMVRTRPTYSSTNLLSKTPTATPTPIPLLCEKKNRSFQTGISYPQWEPTGYGKSDTRWLDDVKDMHRQTSACWIQMPILLYQNGSNATQVTTSVSTVSVESFAYGVQYAHSLGIQVFATIIMKVEGPGGWAGSIELYSYEQQQQWFQSYWQAVKPYMEAAQKNGVEQFAIGTELQWLQDNAAPELWNGLIGDAHKVYNGKVTYDINWPALQLPIPDWMRQEKLAIGVSAYVPVIESSYRVEPEQIAGLWKEKVQTQIDTFAEQLGKAVFISEVGYRNSADALYNPYASETTSPPDPAVQAAACAAVLESAMNDKHIYGAFFWGWDDVGTLKLKDQPAAGAIQNYYKKVL